MVMKRTYSCILLLLLAVLSASFGNNGWAQAVDENRLQVWEIRLEVFEPQIADGSLSEAARMFLRDQVERVILDATQFRDQVLAKEGQLKPQLEALGPAPVEGAAPEDAAIAKTRDQLTSEVAAVAGWVKRTDLIITRAKQLRDRLARISRERLQADLLVKGVSLLSLDTWMEGGRDTLELARATFLEAPANWWRAMPNKVGFLVGLLIVIPLMSGIGLVGRRRILGQFKRDAAVEQPSASERLLSGLAEAVARNLLPVLLTLAAIYLLGNTGAMDQPMASLSRAIFRNLAYLFIGVAIIRSCFSRKQPQWNLLDLPPALTHLLPARLRLVLVIFLVFNFSFDAMSWSGLSPEFKGLFAIFFSLFLAVPVLSLTRPVLWVEESAAPASEEQQQGGGEGEVGSRIAPLFLNLISLAVLLIPVTALWGYANLAIHLAGVLVAGGLIIGVAFLARLVFRQAADSLFIGSHPISSKVRENLAIGPNGAQRLSFWFGLFGDLLIVLLAALVALPIVGFGTEETFDWIDRVLRGVEVGGFTFSLWNVIFAIGLFSMVLLLTGLLQRGLDRHILPNITRDRGIRDALKTGVGYLGFVVAALVAVATAGLDLSNLAIIAGALSVGIGFGLQNVVNNFVSGLILLIERPIKPGDWVVIGSHEGTVKKVNVRSTEILTFQRASVIIPNADMIANAVTNWTYKDMSGRLELPVGVDYESDVDQVVEILLECAKNHPRLAKYPEPYVLFRNFGASSLDFELRAFLYNVEYLLNTQSDLRFEIYRKFKERHITIPYNQMVMHIQNQTDFPGVAKPQAEDDPGDDQAEANRSP